MMKRDPVITVCNRGCGRLVNLAYNQTCRKCRRKDAHASAKKEYKRRKAEKHKPE